MNKAKKRKLGPKLIENLSHVSNYISNLYCATVKRKSKSFLKMETQVSRKTVSPKVATAVIVTITKMSQSRDNLSLSI